MEGEEERKRGMAMLGGESGFDDGEMEEVGEGGVRGTFVWHFSEIKK